ncbi:MAG: ABC transporter ATP-binding protein [Lachnospira sp.]
MKRIIRYAKSYCMQILLISLSGFGCSIANVCIVDILKQIIDMSVSGEVVSFLPGAIQKAVVAVLIGMLANYLVIRITGYFGAGILKDMRCDLVNHIVKVAPDLMERSNFGDIMERLSSDVDVIAGYMQTYFKDCLYVPIIVIVFAVYLFSMNPVLAVLCLGPLIVMVPLSIKLLKPVKMAQTEYVKKLGLTNNHIQEAFDGVEVIKSYNLQEKMKGKYFRALKDTLDISHKNDLRQYNIEPLSALIREAPTAIALCVGGYFALKGELSLGILVAFISGIQKINEPLVNAYQLVVRTQMAMISAKRVFEIMDMPVECEEKGTSVLEKLSENVFEFKNVSFIYPDSENLGNNVLQQFNLSVGQGKRVALVGRSGSGKSTIMKLMCRQYEAEGGEIYFYGNKFGDVSPQLVRSRLALISQEPVIFPMSVRDNIRIGNPEANDEEIMSASIKAGCHEFITKMPEGYETILEERGNNLSGGQRQRIAIARAILKDAPIILLDEPTSALDKETEKYVNETILSASLNKTMITVAHRLNTIVNYDEIIVLEDGKIVERGTHHELMNGKNKYYDMYNEYMLSEGGKI